MPRAKLEYRVNEVALPGDAEKLFPANHSYYVYTDEKGRQYSVGVYPNDIPSRLDARSGEYKENEINYPPDGDLTNTYSIEIDTKGRHPEEVFKEIKSAYQKYEDARLPYNGLGFNCNAAAYSAGVAAGITPQIPPNTNRATPGFGIDLNYAVELTEQMKLKSGNLLEQMSAPVAQTLPQRDIQSTREPAQNQLPDATRAISGNQAGVDGYEYSAQQQGGRGIEIER
jgi:hypothetical protein